MKTYENLGVLDVAEEYDFLRVSIYGSSDCVVGTLNYHFEDDEIRRGHLATIQGWADNNTALLGEERDDGTWVLQEMTVGALP